MKKRVSSGLGAAGSEILKPNAGRLKHLFLIPQPRAQSQPIFRSRDSRVGFTLVEILVSVAILAVGSVVLCQALARGAYAVALAKRHATAYLFSISKLADLELMLRQGPLEKTSGQFGAGRDAFVWKVDAEVSPELPQLQQLKLTVNWKQGDHIYDSELNLVRRIAEPRQ